MCEKQLTLKYTSLMGVRLVVVRQTDVRENTRQQQPHLHFIPLHTHV